MSNKPTTEQIRTAIAEDRAHIDNRAVNRGYTDHLLIRYWKDVDPDIAEACVSYLGEFGSAKNKGASVTVKDPMASNVPHAGDWHVAPAEIRRDPQTGNLNVYQTLFKGSLIIPSESTWFLVEDTASEQVYRRLYLQVIERPTCPADDPPTLTTYRMSEMFVDQIKGTFTCWLDKRVGIDQTATAAGSPAYSDYHEERAFETIDGERHSKATAALPDVTQSAGSIVRTENTPTESGYRTLKETRACIEGAEIAEKEIDAFSVKERDVTLNQTAAITEESAQTAGMVKRTTSKKNDFQKFDNGVETETSTERSAAAASKRYEADKIVEVAEAVNLVTEPTLPSSLTEGILVTMRKQLNRFLRWNSETTTVTSTESLYPTGTTDLSWTGKNGTYYGKFLFNVRKANLEVYIQAFASRHSGFSVSGAPGSRNPDGTYDAVLVAAPLSGGGLSGDAWTTGTASFSYTNRKGQAVTVYKKFTTSLSAAQTFMGTSAGGTIVGSDEGHVTDIFPSTNGKIVAIRVEVT